MKILIAIPCMDTIYSDFASRLLDLQKPPGTKVCLKSGSLVYDSRNLLSLTALEGGYDRVLWLDSDVLFPPDTLTKLCEDMDGNGYDLVSGLYFRRHLPTSPVLFSRVDPPEEKDGSVVKTVETYRDYPEDSLFSIDGCGFGCVLTTTDLLRRVWDRFGPAFYPLPWAGEDISFCYRAKLLGANMACDSSIPLAHIGQAYFTESVYKNGR